MGLDNIQIENLSQQLIKAEDSLMPMESLTGILPEITISEAYAIQIKTAEYRVANGAKIVGKKIGLTSKALQESYNVREPNFGQIFDKAVFMEGQPISINHFLRPRIESEICFILKKDLRGPGINTAGVLSATAGVMPAFEIIDSRYKASKVKIQDAISDNASNAGIVLGGRLTPINDLDLRLIGLVLEKNGEIVTTAAGAAVWGNPAQAVSWLANKLGEYGLELRSGDLIMAGSLVFPIPIEADSSFRATFDHLGSVSARFIK